MSSSALSLIGIACFGVTVLAQNPSAPAAAVPEFVRARCVTCHGADLIQQQRLGRAGWERELDKMIRWGAVVPDAERGTLVEYLATIMRSPASVRASAADGRGAELYAQRCLGCHGSDIVEQQRLGTAGWRREVDKMAGWGARVAPEDKDPLVTYLSAHFGAQ